MILGAAKPANASCPDDCLVEARVTGFQTSIGKLQNPFVAPEDGEIVAWSLKQGKPRKADRRAFNEEFGPPKARIGILRAGPGHQQPAPLQAAAPEPGRGPRPVLRRHHHLQPRRAAGDPRRARSWR